MRGMGGGGGGKFKEGTGEFATLQILVGQCFWFTSSLYFQRIAYGSLTLLCLIAFLVSVTPIYRCWNLCKHQLPSWEKTVRQYTSRISFNAYEIMFPINHTFSVIFHIQGNPNFKPYCSCLLKQIWEIFISVSWIFLEDARTLEL